MPAGKVRKKVKHPSKPWESTERRQKMRLPGTKNVWAPMSFFESIYFPKGQYSWEQVAKRLRRELAKKKSLPLEIQRGVRQKKRTVRKIGISVLLNIFEDPEISPNIKVVLIKMLAKDERPLPFKDLEQVIRDLSDAMDIKKRPWLVFSFLEDMKVNLLRTYGEMKREHKRKK